MEKKYKYAVRDQDLEGDGLSYSLLQLPVPGHMTIDPESGLIQWTPSDGFVGEHDMQIQVVDIHGGSALQTYTLVVATDALNQAPTIDSQPPRLTTP